MKLVKKMLYLVGIVAGIAVLVLLGTAIVQIGMVVVSENLGVTIAEDVLYQVSGSCGIAVAALLCAGYVRRKKYTECIVRAGKFRMMQAVYYMILSVCVCKVLLGSMVTLLCSHTIPVTEQMMGNMGSTYIDLLFGLVAAPIFEELLFRMGIYSLLRRRFRRESAVLIGALGFALIHGYQLQGFLSCLAAGIVFALIYDKSGNLWYCIGAHMFCNLFAYVMNMLEKAGVTLGGVLLQYEVKGYNTYHPMIIVAAAVFCGASVARYYGYRNKDRVLSEN